MFRVFLLCLSTSLMASPLWAETRVPFAKSEIQLGFAPVVQNVVPAVVNIYARRVVNARSSPFRGDPFFGRFFEEFGAVRPQIQNSLGSGVILGDDGIVVSNYHVVGEATDIRVVLNDRREYAARVLLGDEEADLAILQLEDAKDLSALELRDSDSVQVGELVLAIGNPFGLGQTVSSGIVSGLARSGAAMSNARGYFIQTDAPINPGNSGGALVDVNGLLIGINTSIVSRTGDSSGIGFAIPSALVAKFVEQARAGRTEFERPWAGLGGQPVTPDMAEGLGLARPDGIAITQVHPQSPFADAGLRPGDVIITVDDLPVNSPAEMVFRMSIVGIGNEARIGVLRNGDLENLVVRMMAAPDSPPRAQIVTGTHAALPQVSVSTINPAVIEKYRLPLTLQGVVIDDPGPYGARAGMRVGDVLLSVNGVEVSDSASAAEALERAGRTLAIEVQRGGQRFAIKLRI